MTDPQRSDRAYRNPSQVDPMRLPFLIALAALVAAPAAVSAQCCGQPTVAYSPVVAPAPTVVQATTVSEGWYPGKYLTDFTRSLFGANTTTTYTTNYAPSPYTAGYAPSPYTAGYAPTYQTAYRPVYPASYGAVQTVNRPVVLSPVVSAPACGGCGACSACDSCSGVGQAVYSSPSTGCSSCAGGATYEAPLSGGGSSVYEEPRPSLAPDASVPATRDERSIRQRPEVDDSFDDDAFPEDFDDETFEERTEGDPAAANEYWRAPPLFAPPSNRVTRNPHPAPVRTAVYRRPADVEPTAYRPARREAPPQGKVHRLSADGWASSD